MLKIFKFLDNLGLKLNIDMVKLNKAIKSTDFDKMKNLEKILLFLTILLVVFNLTQLNIYNLLEDENKIALICFILSLCALLLILILMMSFLIPQEPCEGTCLSEEETKNLYNNIQELQFDLDKNKEIIENLNSQIYMYIQSDSLYKSQIEDYKTKLQYKDEMIELVKPQWYENKYLWFGMGVIFTASSVRLAGKIN